MKVTTRDIAQAANVSQTTVSLVLNHSTKASISPETREKVLKTAKSMGYQFKKRAHSLTQKPLIGLLTPTLTNPYYPSLIQNIELYARSLGLTLVMQNTLRSVEYEAQSFQYLRKIGVQGILCLFTPKAPLPTDLPIVIIGEKGKGIQADTISLNSYAAGKLAADHLLSLGHRQIAYLSTPFTNMTDARRKRMEGIRARMEEEGVQDCLTVLVDDPENERFDGAYEFDCGKRLTEMLLHQYPDCTAIIAVNDMTALGCMAVLNRHCIRIPQDMALCGFDNLYTHQLTNPQLTSIDQMAFHGCKAGMQMLLDKINHPLAQTPPVFMEYEPRLYARGSTDPEKSP